MDENSLIRLYRVLFIVGDQYILRILYELLHSGDKTFSELRDGLQINPATLSKKLKFLQTIDLVAADRSHDRRRVYYTLHDHQRSLRKLMISIERFAEEF